MFGSRRKVREAKARYELVVLEGFMEDNERRREELRQLDRCSQCEALAAT